MRLKSVYISQYKNLRDFTLNFDGTSFIDIFVGKNATGKSNMFEALIEIFRHVVEFDREKAEPGFNYRLNYEINGRETEIAWDPGTLRINGKERKTISKTPLPDKVLIYYSVTDIVEFVRRLVFNTLIGNADMHLKNWSLIFPNRRQAVLAPAYDFVSTIPYIQDATTALSLVKTKKRRICPWINYPALPQRQGFRKSRFLKSFVKQWNGLWEHGKMENASTIFLLSKRRSKPT